MHMPTESRLVVALVLAGLPLCASPRAQQKADNELPAAVVQSAEAAIRSKLGGVFVVTVQHSKQVRRSRVFAHAWSVDEVIKPYRNDDGIYWIPLEANELTAERKPDLQVGSRYLVVTQLKLLPYGWTYIQAHYPLGANEGDGLAGLRALARKEAMYGSSRFLTNWMEGEYDALGVRSPHADGSLDPSAFGFTREVVARARASEDLHLLVARCITNRPNPQDDYDIRVRILACLDNRESPLGTAAWVRPAETPDKRRTKDQAIASPYKQIVLGQGYTILLLMDTGPQGLPRLWSYMPLLNENDAAVRTIRKWLEEKK